jgi:hypothetical protein
LQLKAYYACPRLCDILFSHLSHPRRCSFRVDGLPPLLLPPPPSPRIHRDSRGWPFRSASDLCGFLRVCAIVANFLQTRLGAVITAFLAPINITFLCYLLSSELVTSSNDNHDTSNLRFYNTEADYSDDHGITNIINAIYNDGLNVFSLLYSHIFHYSISSTMGLQYPKLIVSIRNYIFTFT